jgi:hypothetical protein
MSLGSGQKVNVGKVRADWRACFLAVRPPACIGAAPRGTYRAIRVPGWNKVGASVLHVLAKTLPSLTTAEALAKGQAQVGKLTQRWLAAAWFCDC